MAKYFGLTKYHTPKFKLLAVLKKEIPETNAEGKPAGNFSFHSQFLALKYFYSKIFYNSKFGGSV